MELLGPDGTPVTREWFVPVEDKGETISFIEVLGEWDVLEADMHHYFGVDLDSDVVRKRDWRWFAVRVYWLLGNDTLLRRVLRPPKDTGDTTGHDNA